MPAMVINSPIFGQMFGTNEMRAIFGDRSMVQRYLDVEAALACVQSDLGIIPAAAAQAIREVAKVERVDFEQLRERTEIVGYPILPLVEQMAGWAQGGLGEYAHWGATTQDIMDTAEVLRIRVYGGAAFAG